MIQEHRRITHASNKKGVSGVVPMRSQSERLWYFQKKDESFLYIKSNWNSKINSIIIPKLFARLLQTKRYFYFWEIVTVSQITFNEISFTHFKIHIRLSIEYPTQLWWPSFIEFVIQLMFSPKLDFRLIEKTKIQMVAFTVAIHTSSVIPHV